MSDGLLKAIQSLIPTETVGGVDVEECGAQSVMLDVEFTPVLPYRLANDPSDGRLPECPIPCRVQQEGSRWCVWLPPDDPAKYRWVTEAELKVMRARYILLKNWFFTNIEGCDNHTQQVIVSRFFPGGLFKSSVLKNDAPQAVVFR